MSSTKEAETTVLEDASSRRPISVPPAAAAHYGVSDSRRYHEKQLLGRGGMGEVTLVEDERIGRRIALKRIKLGDAGMTVQTRFAREARIQAQLEHPAIVPVYDIGVEEDGSFYFTMKRVRGKSLAAVLKELRAGDATAREQYSRRRLLSAFSQVCLAVHYAHEHGVIHRDIKPSNIMFGEYGEVYLLDWGIAKLLGEHESALPVSAHANADEAQTRVGDVVGTPGYMSPEQARGLAAVVGPAADVYSLGAILFEIVTLMPLIPRNERDESLVDTLRGACAKPSVRAPDIKVPIELEALCVAATEYDETKRMASARKLHDAIEAILDGDRDLEVQRALAKKHAGAAAESAAALEADPQSEVGSERGAALRGLGQALALDPKNGQALRTLVGLLRAPPSRVPPEVEEARHRVWSLLMKRGGLVGAICYFGCLLCTFLLETQHVKDATALHGMDLLWGVAGVVGLVVSRRPSFGGLITMFVLGVAASVWALRSVMGPFAVVPGMLALHGVIYSLTINRRVRLVVLISVCLAWTICVFGEGWGLLAPTTQFLDGALVVRSPVVELSAGFARGFLYLTVLFVIIIPSLVAGRVRAAQWRDDERMRVLMWQLQQLLPEEVRATA